MQTELLETNKWKTRVELSAAIFDWTEVFYNRNRRDISPTEPERRHQQHNPSLRLTPTSTLQKAEHTSRGLTNGSSSS